MSNDYFKNVLTDVSYFLRFTGATAGDIKGNELDHLTLWAQEEILKLKCIHKSDNIPSMDIVNIYNKWKFQDKEDFHFQKYLILDQKLTKSGVPYLKMQLANTSEIFNLNFPQYLQANFQNVFQKGRIISMSLFKAFSNFAAMPQAFVVELNDNEEDMNLVNYLLNGEFADRNDKFEIVEKNDTGFLIRRESVEFQLFIPSTHKAMRSLLNSGEFVVITNVFRVDEPSGLYFTIDSTSLFFRLPVKPSESKYFRCSLRGQIVSIETSVDYAGEFGGSKMTIKNVENGDFLIVTFSNFISSLMKDYVMKCRIGHHIWMFGLSWKELADYDFDAESCLYNLDLTPSFYFSQQKVPISLKRLSLSTTPEIVEVIVLDAHFFPVNVHSNCNCVLSEFNECPYCMNSISTNTKQKLLFILDIDDGTDQIKVAGICEDLEICHITYEDYELMSMTERDVIDSVKKEREEIAIQENNRAENDDKAKSEKHQKRIDDMVNTLSRFGVTIERAQVESDLEVEDESTQNEMARRMQMLFISQRSQQVINDNIVNSGRRKYEEYQENWRKKLNELIGQTFVFGLSRQQFNDFGPEAKLIEFRINYAVKPRTKMSIAQLISSLNSNNRVAIPQLDLMFSEAKKKN
ncbi:hypothetical protein TVAG_110470 [Trichomonas vaginalis G3]|uniref:Uncharacterized protein n=1 Tax=Trichomonas vaginalis (strain ATCC PRA-98 / G3) TaxID=412133 RepID=A2DGP8_TRIV3|nr:cell division control protein 24, OB domain 3 family [Trichomonas vaginalis G3]EAY20435.1 hypothetical protein TVAG_110470 [Trichomonas vaginalis G3]KAI5490515.1 cell division control protein 24, OB domain 3 family [Trichomonas vaginalis G3]|eukprot:XP_001581421.1 hypothetical protein [Trichomonas vaginalis G3]